VLPRSAGTNADQAITLLRSTYESGPGQRCRRHRCEDPRRHRRRGRPDRRQRTLAEIDLILGPDRFATRPSATHDQPGARTPTEPDSGGVAV